MNPAEGERSFVISKHTGTRLLIGSCARRSASSLLLTVPCVPSELPQAVVYILICFLVCLCARSALQLS